MMEANVRLGLLAVTLCAAGFGCAEQAVAAPEFEDEQGVEITEKAAYANGPHGFDVGSIIPDIEFVGYGNFMADSSQRIPISLADFYNPTGDEVFPDDSPHGAGQPKPKAINLLVSSTWCPPCRAEAKDVLPDKYSLYKPQGGHFVAVLIDGPIQGVGATYLDLDLWASTYQIDYTMVMDPSAWVMSWYDPAFPGNIIIRTSDMKIILRTPGVPQFRHWMVFEQVMDGSYVDPTPLP